MMKRILVFLMLLASCGWAQTGFTNWGSQVAFGWSFENTDSLKLRAADIQTHLRDTTLYSSFIARNPETDEGIWSVAAYLDSSSGASASVQLAVRLGIMYRKGDERSLFSAKDSLFVRWGPWKPIFAAMKIDTLYHKVISPADSSWFMPSSGYQFRLIEADADTCKPHITDFSR